MITEERLLLDGWEKYSEFEGVFDDMSHCEFRKDNYVLLVGVFNCMGIMKEPEEEPRSQVFFVWNIDLDKYSKLMDVLELNK